MCRGAVGASDEARAEGARYYWTRKVDGEGRLDSAPISRFARFCLLQCRRGRRWRQSCSLKGGHFGWVQARRCGASAAAVLSRQRATAALAALVRRVTGDHYTALSSYERGTRLRRCDYLASCNTLAQKPSQQNPRRTARAGHFSSKFESSTC